jgi:excisionase family DNA binding protein
MEKMLSRNEAASALGISAQTVSRLITGGEIVGYRIGKRQLMVAQSEVERYIDKCKCVSTLTKGISDE